MDRSFKVTMQGEEIIFKPYGILNFPSRSKEYKIAEGLVNFIKHQVGNSSSIVSSSSHWTLGRMEGSGREECCRKKTCACFYG